jgi:hypothetical protein
MSANYFCRKAAKIIGWRLLKIIEGLFVKKGAEINQHLQLKLK